MLALQSVHFGRTWCR